MTSSTVYIENIAQEFWTLVGNSPDYPCDIGNAITFTLPLEVVGIAKLQVHDIQTWTYRTMTAHDIRGRDRRLHGCLLADRGEGVIFYDTDDPLDEQRVTLAHELAHFLVDYQAPRERAISIFGAAILPVLDGDRSATDVERLHAVLSTVHLGRMSHIMERPDEGLPSNIVLDIEERTDRLALEVLAPASLLQEYMQQAPVRGFKERLTFLTQHVCTIHGLPEHIASSYARYVLRQMGEPTFRDLLFRYAE
jgi:hypothetical protein